jgi:hypothetical protein
MFQKKIRTISESIFLGIPSSAVDSSRVQTTYNEGDPVTPDNFRGNCMLTGDETYRYCYQNLLIESREWATQINTVLSYLSRTTPLSTKATLSPKPSKAGKDAKGGKASPRNKKPENESLDKDDKVLETGLRNKELKSTMDKASKLQNYRVLKFSSEENLAQFLQFLGDHMTFTETMVQQTIIIGDMVEQAIRLNNLKAYDKNKAWDKKKEERKKAEEDGGLKQPIRKKIPEKTVSSSTLHVVGAPRGKPTVNF